MDAEFMSITKFDGRVLVVKMPPIIDPISIEKQADSNTLGNDNSTLRGYDQSAFEEQGVSISGDLESVKVKDLSLAEIQVANIPPR